MFFHKVFCYRTAKTSCYLVFFCRYDGTTVFGCSEDRCRVKRFNGRDINNTSIDALFGKFIGSNQSFPYHWSTCTDSNITTLTEDLCFAYFERRIFCRERRYIDTSKTYIDRTDKFTCGDRRFLCLIKITRDKKSHVRKNTSDSDLFEHLVRCAVWANRYTSMSAADLYV